jgi:hypothetical protein
MRSLVHVIVYQSLMSERRIAAGAVVIAVPDSFTFTQPPRIEGGELIWYRERHPV